MWEMNYSGQKDIWHMKTLEDHMQGTLHLTLTITVLLLQFTVQYITGDGQLRCVFSNASLVRDHTSIVATMTRCYSIYGQNARKWCIVANINPGSIAVIFMAQRLRIFTPRDVKGPISLACSTHNLRSHSLCHTILKIKGGDPWRDWNMQNQQKKPETASKTQHDRMVVDDIMKKTITKCTALTGNLPF